MKKIIVLLFMLIGISVIAQMREPAVAGQWYPADKSALSKMLSSFFQNIDLQKNYDELFGIISPHAGFVYSGQVAAYGYSLLKDTKIDVVFLIGPSHHFFENKISIYAGESYQIPTGKIDIAQNLAHQLLETDENFVFNQKLHQPEHSLEAQLPFLDHVLDDFKIVPILTSTNNFSLLKKMAKSICKIVEEHPEKKFLFICSSDMSHYHSDKIARKMDHLTIDLILQKNWSELQEKIQTGKCELCGYAALQIFLEVMRSFGNDDAELLYYANSGNISGNSQNVVGYSSIVFPKQKEKIMTEEEKNYLLNLARKSIKEYLLTGEKHIPAKPKFDLLKKERAVFVTLHKDGQLRGCIGHMHAQMPLYQAVAEMAVSAAFQDPRFPKLQKNELSQIEIEISVLSPMQRIQDYEQIKIGRDGVWVKKGFQSGVYLPQVAEETGWDREQFLESLCAHKAGLPKDAYKEPDIELYIFQVEKFSE